MKHLVLVIALAAFSTSAFAEGSYQSADELRLVRAVSVEIRDSVTDGCLSNPNALKVEAELILRRSNVLVSEEVLDYQLDINATGWEIGRPPTGACVVMLQVALWRFAKVPEGHSALILTYDKGFLLLDDTKTATQDRLRTLVSEFVSDLANEILKAQGN